MTVLNPHGYSEHLLAEMARDAGLVVSLPLLGTSLLVLAFCVARRRSKRSALRARVERGVARAAGLVCLHVTRIGERLVEADDGYRWGIEDAPLVLVLGQAGWVSGELVPEARATEAGAYRGAGGAFAGRFLPVDGTYERIPNWRLSPGEDLGVRVSSVVSGASAVLVALSLVARVVPLSTGADLLGVGWLFLTVVVVVIGLRLLWFATRT
jgi:hypothetical protein